MRTCFAITGILTLWLAHSPVVSAKGGNLRAAAAKAYDKGTQLFEAEDYEAAAKAFQESYRLRPHFLTRCNVARCHERLQGMRKAAEFYQKCLDEGGKKGPMAKEIADALAEVEKQITQVTVTSPVSGGTIYVDGVPAGEAPKVLALDPGSYVVELRLKGYSPARMTVETRGGTNTIELLPVKNQVHKAKPPAAVVRHMEPVERPREGVHQAWFWAGTGLTVALAAAGTVFGVMTLRANRDFEATPTWDGYDKVVNYRLMTNVMFGAAAATAVGSSILYFYTDFGRKKPVEGAASETAYVVGVTGTF